MRPTSPVRGFPRGACDRPPAGRTPDRPARRAGFTLLELLLTLVILALLLGGVYAVLLGTLQAVERVEFVTQRAETGLGILQVVARDFEHAVMPGGVAGGAFQGKPVSYGAFNLDRVDFVANVPALGPPAGPGEPPRPSPMNEVGYRCEPNPFIPGLFRLYRREGFFVDGDPLSGGMLYEVYDRVHAFKLDYFDGKEWAEQWTSGDRGVLPMAVRIGLEVEVGTPDAAPGSTKGVQMVAYQIVVTIPQ